MMREKFTLATIAKRSAFAVAGLVLAATMDVASASTAMGSANASARFGSQHPIRLAETVAVTKPRYMKKTNVPHKVQRGPGTNWLNPQPEPPLPASKLGSGGTWLNPQPEPPRPDTGTKKLH